MPATRGVKRTASKASASTASTAPKNKKKRVAIQLEIPTPPKRRCKVYACGQGDVGQLGLGEDVIETNKFKHVTALGDKIVSLSAGGMHNVALDSSGKVWTYGCNDEGALGRVTSGDKDEATPKKVSLPHKAVMITAGDSHSAALLENGDVYAWGSFRDSHGSMGLVVRGREGKPCREPVKVEFGETAVNIASGGDHLVILSKSGFVYTMGCGEQGQLGRVSQRSAGRNTRQGFSPLLVPARVSLKAGASRVWAGYHATFVLDAARERVFAFGLNNYGQLGITGQKRRDAIYAPLECDAFTRKGSSWSMLAVGQHHSLALDGNGKVYAVGRCEYGRLGLGDRAGDAEELELIPKLSNKKCVSIAAGICNSFAVTDTGEVFSWGMGSEGQLGTGGTADVGEPTPAVLPPAAPAAPAAPAPARHVAAGGQHAVLLLEDPNARNVPSPEPESETAEEKMETHEEDEKEKKPRNKRQRGQDNEVTSTSSEAAQSSEVKEETQPQKVNGDEQIDAAMDVDETDNKQDLTEKNDENDQKMDTDQTETKDTAETSSHATSDSETKFQDDSQDSEKSQESEKSPPETEKSQESEKSAPESEKSQDSQDSNIELKAEVNGTEESDKIEAKSVDSIPNPLTTTA